ncbi:hypothetical protein MAM1_0145c06526 [Mucor ambiguus]|uniref:Zn(2)-C6 fungal-type domain-containing protein n=1 Tax=Mucor ambiguus TaxID=91626 RepID=A0A0C9M9B5_9FUNG|nr:hypothetical protein MAM1_0145c06526 [Mucor ambiguus]
MSFYEENKQKRNKPCENCRAHRRKCKVSQGTQCDRCVKMNLACVFKFTAKPTVIKKAVPLSRKNRMLEQVRMMEQEMQAMEQQLKLLNVEVHIQPQENISDLSSSSSSSTSSGSSMSTISETTFQDDDDVSAHTATATSCECTDPLHCLHIHTKRMKVSPATTTPTALVRSTPHQWQLTVSQGPQGMRFQTSIRSISDVAVFVTESLRYFTTAAPLRTPNYHAADRTQQQLQVTNKMLQIEKVLHSFFKNKQQQQNSRQLLIAPPYPADAGGDLAVVRTSIKRQLVQSYFACAGLINPIFSKPCFLPLLEAHPNSLAATACCAFVAYSQCKHVTHLNWPVSRESFAESLRQEAKDMLEDVLFEQEPDILIAGALMLLAQCALITLQNGEGRLYTSLCWRMALQLKDKYVATLSTLTPDSPHITPQQAVAESWRRLFYAARYLELNMYMIYDGLADFSSILFDSGIGLPVVLSNERGEVKQAIQVFHHVVRLHNCQMSARNDQLKYQLFAGNLSTISVHDVERLENQLINFWKSLPVDYRLSDSPLEYLQTDRIQQCENPYAIYLNQLYYAYWLALETRLMRSPSSTDLLGANMERFDGERALLIVSVSCDSISKIFHVLYCRLPCSVELHWLMIASDAMAMLKKAANPHIKARAQKNLKVTLRVMKHRVQQTDQLGDSKNDDYNLWKNMLPSSSSPEASMSTSTSSSSLAGSETSDDLVDQLSTTAAELKPSNAYIKELKKTFATYFPDYEQKQTPS